MNVPYWPFPCGPWYTRVIRDSGREIMNSQIRKNVIYLNRKRQSNLIWNSGQTVIYLEMKAGDGNVCWQGIQASLMCEDKWRDQTRFGLLVSLLPQYGDQTSGRCRFLWSVAPSGCRLDTPHLEKCEEKLFGWTRRELAYKNCLAWLETNSL